MPLLRSRKRRCSWDDVKTCFSKRKNGHRAIRIRFSIFSIVPGHTMALFGDLVVREECFLSAGLCKVRRREMATKDQ
jgi:hypothetical protein